MDFSFSDEQEALRSTAMRFFDTECPASRVRKVVDMDGAHDPSLWTAMAQNGWMGIGVPEEHGGFGSFLDLVVILEEAGKRLLPGPYLSTMGLLLPVLLQANEEQKARYLPRLASGELTGTLALTESSGHWDADGIRLVAARDGSGWRLRGRKRFVPDAAVADVMVVAARASGQGEDGVILALVEGKPQGVHVRERRTLDATRQWYDVDFDDIVVSSADVIGEASEGWHILRNALDWSEAAICAEMVGGMSWILETSVDYAKVRRQFGKAIGSYQAVSHRLANLLLETESSRSATYYAAWAVETAATDRSSSTAMAKAYVSDAYRKAAWCGIQTHGGIGFTWEHDMHLYFKRAKATEVFLGDATYHRERVAALLEM